MDQLHQLSAQYNALWIETNQLYETWARQRGMSLHELLVILSIVEADGTVLQKDICQRFVIPKQTVNAIIKTLTDKGMAGAQGLGAGPQKQESLPDSRWERTGGADCTGAPGARGASLAPAGAGPGGTVD